MNLTKTEFSLLSLTKSEQEWNDACNDIVRAHGGKYPADWWSVIMMSGFAARQQEKWRLHGNEIQFPS
jgi:hypothetical protein